MSFHRLLAHEIGLIPSIFEKSDVDKKFFRNTGFDKERLINLLLSHNFKVLDFGTFFIKPFANSQLEELIRNGIVPSTIIEGLSNMIKYFPDYGAEMYVTVSLPKKMV